ncbi:hypothetical protein ACEPAI_5621 [Sanghuangporus weigelae]
MLLHILNFAFLSLLFVPTNAWWILAHDSLTQDRLDPIVTPGKVAYHVHNIIGSSGFGPTVSNESLQDANCTTAPVQADKSAYWAPQLYHHDHENGTFTLVPIQYVQTYYLQRPQSSADKSKEVKAFPAGLRMLAGSLRTSYNASNQEDRAVNFVCLDYDGDSTRSDQLPDKSCPDGLRAQVVFPSCWDGVNLDSEDHKSHMSYPLGTAPDSGDCPDSHPVKVIQLFNEWIFETNKFELQPGVKDFVFATGDESGLTFHADFVSAWDVDVLQAAIEQCTGSLFNGVENCPPFVPFIDEEKAKSCKIARRVEEDIDGPLTVLPGCNPVPFTGEATCENLTTPAIKGYSGGDESAQPTGSVVSTVATSAAASFATPAFSTSSDPPLSASVSIGVTASPPVLLASTPSPSASPTPSWSCSKMQKKRTKKRHHAILQHH